MTNCDEKNNIVLPPLAEFYPSPMEGNTTTIFDFDSRQSSNEGTLDTMLFFRWDWNNDGEWDTNFTRARHLDHRFWIKGTYTVVMEASNQGGLRDTISTTIDVVQGYSAPHPKLIVSPGSGHIKTEFVLDASGTTDDEDSISLLKFRWDFEGDGFYDTQWNSEPIIKHVYSGPSYYSAKVQVRDPGGLNAESDQAIMVTINNPRLHVEFSWTPEDGSSVDVFTFDASACYDQDDENNVLKYRWDFNGDDIFDTDYLSNPIVDHIFDDEGENEVRLEVMDQNGLINQTFEPLVVAHANRPPTASFFTGTNYGNLTTDFYFDANGVDDDEDWEYQLTVRWDFESDGVWDTNYAVEKTARHKYGTEGEFNITMEVKDQGGFTASTTRTVTTTGGTNETGLIVDTDSGDTYGTVKIGNQWWVAENLKNTTSRSCYQNSALNCNSYGGLYHWTGVMAGSKSPKAKGLCPSGTHIPTRGEWQTLFDFLGEENAGELLEMGGPTDFRMKYAGQMSNSGNSEYAGVVTNFWTSDEATGDNAWAFSLQAGKNQIWKLTLGKSYRNSVRCIKN